MIGCGMSADASQLIVGCAGGDDTTLHAVLRWQHRPMKDVDAAQRTRTDGYSKISQTSAVLGTRDWSEAVALLQAGWGR